MSLVCHPAMTEPNVCSLIVAATSPTPQSQDEATAADDHDPDRPRVAASPDSGADTHSPCCAEIPRVCSRPPERQSNPPFEPSVPSIPSLHLLTRSTIKACPQPRAPAPAREPPRLRARRQLARASSPPATARSAASRVAKTPARSAHPEAQAPPKTSDSPDRGSPSPLKR